MTLTLAQLASVETDTRKKYVMTQILRDAKAMEVIPWVNVDSLHNSVVRWDHLPTVAFRPINGGYTPNEGTYDEVWEALFGFGGEIRYDRVFDKIKNTITDLKRDQTNMKLKALALTFNHYLINGDHAVDPNGFEGLLHRVGNMPARQTAWFAGAAAAALDPTAAVANGRFYFGILDYMWVACNNKNPSCWFLNETSYWGVGQVARYIQASGGNFLDVTRDSFDRQIVTLHGAPMYDIGLQRDLATEIISNTEVAGDAGLDSTSIYAVSFGGEEGLTGIQLSPMDVYDPLNGEQEATPTKLTRIDWWLGLANYSNFSIVRGRNVEAVANWT